MPNIRPFKGLRYDPAVAGDIATLVAPPYDIIYDEWREKLYERNPYNIIRLIKSKDEPGDTETSNKYTRARDDIEAWIERGILKYEPKPVMYVRAETFAIEGVEQTRYGFIALLDVEEFGNGVYPHERTLAAPKVDRMNLVKATRTNLSQIFSVYRDPDGDIQAIIRQVIDADPAIDFVDEQQIRRQLWVVDDEALIGRMQALMADRDIIIADGHHRYETALAYKQEMNGTGEQPSDYVSMYFSSADDDGMSILPTHRKASGIEDFDPDAFLASLADEFEVTAHDGDTLDSLLDTIAHDSEHRNTFGIFTGDAFYTASLKAVKNPKDLDVEVLHDVIIGGHLGITPEDIQDGRFIHFSKSAEHALEDVRSGKDQAAFFLNAMTSEELFRVVLQGRRMPQKSTYFYPKTLSGLVMYRIDEQSLG